MTAATLHLESILDAIGSLSVSGLTVYDTDTIPDNLDQRLSHLVPRLGDEGFLTDFAIQRQTTGGLSTAALDATYTLHYLFYYKPVGVERGLKNIYPGMVGMAVDILEGLAATAELSGAVRFTPALGLFGTNTGPSDDEWHGCEVTIDVLEFIR